MEVIRSLRKTCYFKFGLLYKPKVGQNVAWKYTVHEFLGGSTNKMTYVGMSTVFSNPTAKIDFRVQIYIYAIAMKIPIGC